jgi:hypothetical protein
MIGPNREGEADEWLELGDAAWLAARASDWPDIPAHGWPTVRPGETVWVARRVGKRILCGRRVPPDGPPKCMGELGTIVHDIAQKEFFAPRPGIVEATPQGEIGDRYRETSQVRFPRLRGRTGPPDGNLTFRAGRAGRIHEVGSGPPLSAPCSHGGHRNAVPRTRDGVLLSNGSSIDRRPDLIR